MRVFGYLAVLAASAILGLACGGDETPEAGAEHGAREKVGEKVEAGAEKVEAGAKKLQENVKHSGEVMKDTYREERQEGEGRIEAAGEAYEAVLEAPKQAKQEAPAAEGEAIP